VSDSLRNMASRGLVYFEAFGDVREAISQEKQIKRWRREKKLTLIRRMNPQFRDLSEDSPW
jgi:putative endonuclease